MIDTVPLGTYSLVVVNALAVSLVASVAATVAVVGVLGIHRRASAALRHSLWLAALIAAMLVPAFVGARAGFSDMSSQHVAATNKAEAAMRKPGRSAWVAPGGVRAPSRLSVPPAIATAAATVWAIGTAVFAARLIFGLLRLRRLIRDAAPAGDELTSLLDTSSAGRRSVPRVLASRDVASPIAVGFGFQAIVLPEGLEKVLSPTQLRGVVAHERAHLERGDDWTNLLACLVSTVAFYNPLIWLAVTRLATEREMACDDRAVSNDPDRSCYGHLLVRLAQLRPVAATTLALGASSRGLVNRIEALMTESRIHTARAGRTANGLAGGAVLIAAFVAGVLQPTFAAESVELGGSATMVRIPFLDLDLGRNGPPKLAVYVAHGKITIVHTAAPDAYRILATGEAIHTPVHVENGNAPGLAIVCILDLNHRCAGWSAETAAQTTWTAVTVAVPSGVRVAVRTIDAIVDDRARATTP